MGFEYVNSQRIVEPIPIRLEMLTNITIASPPQRWTITVATQIETQARGKCRKLVPK